MSRNLRTSGSCVCGLLLLALGANSVAAESPAKLRSSIAKTEKQYFELYNKVNTDPRFEIVCKNEKATGTNFAKRVCRPRYLLDAMQTSASERLRSAIEDNASSGPTNGGGPGTATLTSSALPDQSDKDAAFRQNLLELQKSSPELAELGKQRDELERKLAQATQGKGGK